MASTSSTAGKWYDRDSSFRLSYKKWQKCHFFCVFLLYNIYYIIYLGYFITKTDMFVAVLMEKAYLCYTLVKIHGT